MKITALSLCSVCGHEADEHGKLRSTVNVASNIEACLLCNGWSEDGDYPTKPARHRFQLLAKAETEEGRRCQTP